MRNQPVTPDMGCDQKCPANSGRNVSRVAGVNSKTWNALADCLATYCMATCMATSLPN
jgi:hypothetical protein